MLKRRSLVHRRPGISEILATLIMVAITLVAGAAVFGFVNDQAKVSENQYANSVANNINYLNEHFVIVNVQFPSSCESGSTWTCAQIAIYNTGSATLNINTIIATGTNSSVTNEPLDVVSTRTGTYCVLSTTATSSTISTSTGASVSGVSTTLSTTTVGGVVTTTTVAGISTQNATPVTFTVNVPSSGCPSFAQGDSYQFQVLGLYGNSATYQITAVG